DKYFFDVGLKNLKEKVDNYQLKFLEFKTAKETYTALINSCSDFDYVADRHLLCTDNSSNWNMSMFDILVKEKGSFDNDVYNDFANCCQRQPMWRAPTFLPPCRKWLVK
ncbi:putative phosphoenolpyruvate synthase, partial [Caerostris darwini]